MNFFETYILWIIFVQEHNKMKSSGVFPQQQETVSPPAFCRMNTYLLIICVHRCRRKQCPCECGRHICILFRYTDIQFSVTLTAAVSQTLKSFNCTTFKRYHRICKCLHSIKSVCKYLVPVLFRLLINSCPIHSVIVRLTYKGLKVLQITS